MSWVCPCGDTPRAEALAHWRWHEGRWQHRHSATEVVDAEWKGKGEPRPMLIQVLRKTLAPVVSVLALEPIVDIGDARE